MFNNIYFILLINTFISYTLNKKVFNSLIYILILTISKN